MGTLHWNDGKEDWSSPILLVPIEFTKPIDDVSYFQLADGDITFNPALVEKLRADLGVDIDPSIDEDAPIEVITRLKSLISGRKNWSVDESAALGIFSFSKEVMFRDLLENEEKILASDLVAALAFGAESGIDLSFQLVAEDELDLISPPSSLSSILDADATQRQAIVAAKSGKSFVIDGPPGSGKSQTIANIIAELISDGRSVLFVSEKAAALEVVHNRLEEAGLGSFLLPLHSQKITRKDFASQLRKAVTERVSTGKKLSSTQRERLTHNQKALSAYAAAMNEVREPLGKSLHEVIGEFAQLNETPDAPLPTLTVTEEMAPDFVLAAQDVAEKLSRTWRQIGIRLAGSSGFQEVSAGKVQDIYKD